MGSLPGSSPVLESRTGSLGSSLRTSMAMLAGKLCTLRPYSPEDVSVLPLLLGEWEVARWLTADIPHPYTASDAEVWVARAAAQNPTNTFAIEVEGKFAGTIAIFPRNGEFQGVAEFGYWLGHPYWGRGIASEAVRLLAAHALHERGFRRLEAYVFAPNIISMHILEKCGFTREAVLREVFVDREKNVHDGILYVRLRSEEKPPTK